MTVLAADTYASLTQGTELVGTTSSGGQTWAGDSNFWIGGVGGGFVTSKTAQSARGNVTLGSALSTGNYKVKATITQTDTISNGQNSAGVTGRNQVNGDHIFCLFNGSTWGIWTRDSSVGDTRWDSNGVSTNSPTIARIVEVTFSGTSAGGGLAVTLTSGGTTVASATITSNTRWDSNGKPGLKFNFSDHLAVAMVIDDFEVNDTSSSVTGPLVEGGALMKGTLMKGGRLLHDRIRGSVAHNDRVYMPTLEESLRYRRAA